MGDMAAFGLFWILVILVIFVAIMRWVFRINDIVNRLDKIVTLLTPKKTV